jgi:C1A family cysteine protease
MKFAVFVAVLGAVAAVSEFEKFKVEYNRVYPSAQDEAKAKKCFSINLAKIAALNAEHRKIDGQEIFAVNLFADVCPEDFKIRHNMQVNLDRPHNYFADLPAPKDTTVDWRTKGAVTPVKDQGQCGSCWAFSSTGNMEGQNFIKHGTLLSISEQELVSCSHNGNQGCNGGLMDQAFDWVASNGGIDSEGDYPYTSGSGNSGNCNAQKEKTFVAHFSGHNDVTKTETAMAAWVAANGPLSIAVDAASGWQNYNGGVMKTCSGRQLDHGVLAVGYYMDSTTPANSYWIVKNSWSASWGEQGYIRLQYGTNQCGINMMPSSSVPQ